MGRKSRTRLSPDVRREQILRAAGHVFGERGYMSVSASDVAREAGVTPGLVYHYFGSKRGLFLALVDELVPQVIDTTRVELSKSQRARVEAYIEAWLDWVEDNRHTWLATAAQGEYIPDPEIRAAVDAAREGGIDGIVASHPESLANTPRMRLMLRSYLTFNRTVLRSWLNGASRRSDAAAILAETLYALITTVAPALEEPGKNAT